MKANKTKVKLNGSERTVLAGAKSVGMTNPDLQLRATILLRSRAQAEDAKSGTKSATSRQRAAVDSMLNQRAVERQHLSSQQFVAARGALEEDVRIVEEFAHAHELTIVSISHAKRMVKLRGTVANFTKAFNVKLLNYEFSGGTYRGRTGPLEIPRELDGIVTAVLGLDNRPQARPHFRVRRPLPKTRVRAHQGSITFTPKQIGQIYDFPSNADGSGQTIAIIELGGGFKAADLEHYFSDILKIPPPKVVAISVGGAQNSPTGDLNGPDVEVMLDIEVVGALAPKASLVVYFAPNTDEGFYDAISSAVHDTRYKPSVISISWGGPESSWTKQSLNEYDKLFEDAITLGVTVCIASGDDGSTDGLNDGSEHVDFPSSSPNVLACGGTRLTAQNGTYGGEIVWNEAATNDGATGGGVSDYFAKPAFQANANVPASINVGNFVGRGVPDVAGDADPTTGYDIYVDGQALVIGGTSAVAPLWAALAACLNQILGKRIGSLNSLLYPQVVLSPGMFHDVVNGNNGAFSAKTGWDACTGLGSPTGSQIAASFRR